MKETKYLNKILASILVVILSVCFLTGFAPIEKNKWIGSWNTSAVSFANMQNNGFFNYKDQTLRTIVTLSYGGTQERIKFSNEYGTGNLEIGAASVAIVDKNGVAKKNTIKNITFNGKEEIVIEDGEYVWSDPINLTVRSQDRIAVSTYLPSQMITPTGGCGNVEAYVSPKGNYILADSTQENYTPIVINDYPNISLFVTSIEVCAPESTRTAIVFGDSISALSWPEYFTEKLNKNGINDLAVIRETIVGNRILHDTVENLHGLFGASGVSRFEKAITGHPGAEYVVVLEGINDIMSTGPGGTSPNNEIVSAEQIIDGLQIYIDLAHKHGLKIYGATIMPFEGHLSYTEEEENVRQEVNKWIRSGGKFDAVIDFDMITRNPSNIKQLLPAYDSGNHVHPSEVGSAAMADAIDVELFR